MLFPSPPFALRYIEQLFPTLQSDTACSDSEDDWQMMALQQFELAVFTEKAKEESTSLIDMVYEATMGRLRGVLDTRIGSGFKRRQETESSTPKRTASFDPQSDVSRRSILTRLTGHDLTMVFVSVPLRLSTREHYGGSIFR